MKLTGWLIAFLVSILVLLANLAFLIHDSRPSLAFFVVNLLAATCYTAIFFFYGPPRPMTLGWWLPFKQRLKPWLSSALVLLAAVACFYYGTKGLISHDSSVLAPNHAGPGRWAGRLLQQSCLYLGPLFSSCALTVTGIYCLLRVRAIWRKDA